MSLEARGAPANLPAASATFLLRIEFGTMNTATIIEAKIAMHDCMDVKNVFSRR
jgi:hypothetical protein